MTYSNTTKAIANNTLYQVVGKLVSMTITVGVTMLVARQYGRLGYGEFNLMQNFPALFFIIVDFGFNAIATRELSKDFSRANEIIGNILTLRLVFSGFLMLLCGIALLFFPYSESLKFGIALSLLLILTQSLYATTNIVFQVKLRYDYSTIGYIVGSLAVLVLVLALSSIRSSVVWVNFSYVLGGFVTFIINYFYVKKLGVSLIPRFDKKIMSYLILQSLPLGLMFVFSQVNFKADAILLSVLSLPVEFGLDNTETVAVYGLPFKVFEVALVVPTFFMNAVYPVLVRHMEEGEQRLKNTFLRSIWVLFAVGMVGGLLGIIFAPFAIKILGGSDFVQSIMVLRILLGGIVLFYISQPVSWLIVTLGGQKWLPGVYLIGAVFNLGANLLFIPMYSFLAAAAITWVSEFLILVLLVYIAYVVWKQKYA